MADLPPFMEPLTLGEVRLNLRQPPEQQNDRLTSLITVAREYAEDLTGMVLTTSREITETVPSLDRWIDLTSWPITSVEEVRRPVHGVLTAMPADAWVYSLKRRPVRLIPTSFGWGGWDCRHFEHPGTLPIEIDLVAGYADPTKIPMRAKQAMHMLIAHWFANPDAVLTGQRAAAIVVPLGVDELLRGLRLVRV